LAKLVMFFGFVWLATSIAGGLMLGSMPLASTALTTAVTVSDSTIYVSSTANFPTPGIIVINDERIAYSAKTATTFYGNLAQPLLRGTQGTTAAVHSITTSDGRPTIVRMVESSVLNNSVDYNVASIVDTAGAQAFITMPVAVFSLIIAFGAAPFRFLGTDLQILTAIWAICFVGMLVSFFISMAGGRRI